MPSDKQELPPDPSQFTISANDIDYLDSAMRRYGVSRIPIPLQIPSEPLDAIDKYWIPLVFEAVTLCVVSDANLSDIFPKAGVGPNLSTQPGQKGYVDELNRVILSVARSLNPNEPYAIKKIWQVIDYYRAKEYQPDNYWQPRSIEVPINWNGVQLKIGLNLPALFIRDGGLVFSTHMQLPKTRPFLYRTSDKIDRPKLSEYLLQMVILKTTEGKLHLKSPRASSFKHGNGLDNRCKLYRIGVDYSLTGSFSYQFVPWELEDSTEMTYRLAAALTIVDRLTVGDRFLLTLPTQTPVSHGSGHQPGKAVSAKVVNEKGRSQKPSRRKGKLPRKILEVQTPIWSHPDR